MLIGIVGKPSSGKSTFLNAACLTEAKTANYPFTTIDPNLGKSYIRVPCVCKEFDIKCEGNNSICIDNERFIPIKLLDVAGLVPGAHEGRGMGNKFLSDLARADALIHVVDISGSLSFEGEEVDEGSHDPLTDIQFLEDEINYWFFNIIKKNDWNKFIRKIQQEKLSFIDLLYERLAGAGVKKINIINAIKHLKLDLKNLNNITDSGLLALTKEIRKNSKPIVIAANKIDKKNSSKILEDLNKRFNEKIIPCSGLAEYWLRKYNEKGLINYTSGDSTFEIKKIELLKKAELQTLEKIKKNIIEIYGETGIQKILKKVSFKILNQIVVYPVADANNLSDKDGRVLPDAFLIEKGMKLKEFVETKIHTDLAKNFIYAINVRNNMRISEDYELKNNDIIKIVSAA